LPQPAVDLPQSTADLSQPVEDDVLTMTKEKFLEIMGNFKDYTFNHLSNTLKQL
jgi:hypothetical protein